MRGFGDVVDGSDQQSVVVDCAVRYAFGVPPLGEGSLVDRPLGELLPHELDLWRLVLLLLHNSAPLSALPPQTGVSSPALCLCTLGGLE